jgi:hypothetical protein
MATLVLKPVFPVRTRSSRPPRKPRHSSTHPLRSRPWRTVAVATGAAALSFFCVLAPLMGDPADRLFALEATSNIPTEEIALRGTWDALAFELTPTMLGPAIPAEMLTFAEELEEDEGVTMPELEVTAVPPMSAPEATPPG